MGRIFKTPKDDSVEETLRAMHLANTVDNAYEWGWGWFRTILIAVLASLAVSFFESISDFSLWGSTVEWFYGVIESILQWLLDKVENVG
mgnify:FL=1|jgi:hypothetical protein|tara:strand:+ start:355 stop:621 length:267 start_codon:yes stop_codon:yes gene_type:complete